MFTIHSVLLILGWVHSDGLRGPNRRVHSAGLELGTASIYVLISRNFGLCPGEPAPKYSTL